MGNVNEVKKESKLKQNMPTLIILMISGAMVYSLPYFKNYYYDAFVKYYNLTNTQMGILGSIFGATSVFSYFFGGILADRWPARNLLTISLISTGALGLAMLLYPPFPILVVIYAAWGITSVLTFWSALVKAVRSIAGADEQGKAFGFFEGGRGITNMIQSVVILSLFGYLNKSFNDKVALSAVIVAYSIICIILGILVFILYKNPESDDSQAKEDKNLFDVSSLKKVIKMPTTWLSVLIIFCSYSTLIGYYYITPYATSVFGVTAVIAAALGYLSQFCRPVGSVVSGILADKIGSSVVAAISYILLIIGLLGVAFTPEKQSMIWLLIVSAAIIYTSMYAVQSMHFAILEEGDYPLEITGAVTAIITPLGYSAEFFIPIIAGRCLDNWPGAEGYKIFFTVLAGIAAVGLLAVLIWMKLTKEKRMKLMQNNK